MKKKTTYRYNKNYQSVVLDHSMLPLVVPAVGVVYQSIYWSRKQQQYLKGPLARYEGNGVWSDPLHPITTRYIEYFPYCDYIEIHPKFN